MLKYEMPALYDVIMKMTPKVPFPEPKTYVIEIVCNSSNDPSLNKAKFERYMELYRKEGIYCKRPKILTEQRAAYYKRLYQKKLERYIERNSSEVERQRQLMRQEKLAKGQN